MFISHKSNVLQTVHEQEWQCRRKVKGLTSSEYHTWLDSVTTVTGTPPDERKTPDYSGETGYVIAECTDEDVWARLRQLGDDYVSRDEVYNIKYYVSKRDSEIVDVPAHTIAAHTDEDGNDVAEEDVATTYVQTHFVADDTALASAKVTAWATYRTKLRTLPADQSSKTTYADITWPSEPS